MTSAEAHAPSWHAEPWQRVQRALGTDRLAHGVLIHGAPGVGKRLFAERAARAVLCRARGGDFEACGQCPACRQFAAGTHPDISRLVPEEAGRQIKVDQVRRFSRALYLTPQYERGRLGWIDPAEGLSLSAANSLLKTLEEPPLNSHVFLITDRLSALMPTVRSRCQLWHVPPASPEAGAAWLAACGDDGSGLDDDSLRAPFAVRLREAEDYATLARGWDDDLARLLARRANAVSVADRAAKAPRGLWIDWAYRRVNALLLASLDGAAATDELPDILRPAARRVAPSIFECFARRVAYIARLAQGNADWRLLLESALLDLGAQLARSDP